MAHRPAAALRPATYTLAAHTRESYRHVLFATDPVSDQSA
ncbi:hypothetical protein XHC_2341 [Xanthomonas hortorum pv. carotae str. M081]|nr:hypothetical protein XHC_2341 [Xanthomonas hortorum pv. carotae str. M081]